MKNPIFTSHGIRRSVLLAAFAFGISSSQAQTTYDWAGATSGNLSDSTNWSPNGSLTGPDTARWNAASYTNAPTADGNVTVGELLFTAANTGGVTFGSGTGTLTLNGVSGVGAQVDSGSGAVNTGSAKFALGATQSWINNSANALTIGGTITNSGNVTAFTLTAGGSGDTSLSGVISNGGTVGTTSLTKSGGGTLTLSGANTFTGATLVSAGTLKVGNGAALGSTAGGTTVASGATLDVGGQNLTTEVVNISGAGVGGAGAIINNGATQINALGRIVLAADATIGGTNRWDLRNSTPTLNLGGFTLTKTGANYIALVGATVSNPGNFVVSQGELSITGTTNLAGTSANTATVGNGATLSMYASTSVHAWTLNLNDGSTLRSETGTAAQDIWAGPVNISGNTTLKADGSLTIRGNIAGTGNITKSGIAAASLNGTNSFSGTTTVNAGTLNLNYATNNTSKLDDSSALILGGGTVSLAGGTHTEVVASTILTAGGVSAVTRASGTSVLQLNTITRNAGASISFGNASATTDNPNTNGILGGWATVGNDWATNSTNGADGLITAYTGYTLTSVAGSSAGNYTTANNVDVNSSPVLDGAVSINSLRFNTAGNTTLSLIGANVIASGGVLVGTSVGNNTSSVTGGSITGPVGGDLVINQQNTSNTLIIGSNIVDNTQTSVLKLGTGTTILTGTHTFTGGTTVAAGTLQLGNGTTDGTIANTSGLTFNGNLVINNVGNVTLSAPLSGTGSFTKTGAGALTINNAATSYTGDTLITGGALTLTGNRVATAGNIRLGGSGAILNIQGDLPLGANVLAVGYGFGTAGVANQIAGTVSFTSGSNALLITNTGLSGTYNLSGGVLQTFASNTRGVLIGTSSGSAGNLINATFNLSGTGNLSNSAGSLQVVRSDAAAAYQNSTYNQTGGTSTNGYLSIGGNGTFGANSIATFSVTGGTFSANSFDSLSVGNNATSTLTIGGTADVTLPAFPTARGTSSAATLYLDGGTLRPLSASATYLGGLTNAFIKAGGARFDVPSGKDITVSQNLLTDTISTGGGLTKNGAGALTLSSANTYTGTTTVSAGTLVLSGGGNINASANITVSTGAALTNDTATPLTPALLLAEGSTLSGVGFFTPSAITLTADLAGGFSPITAGATLTKAGALTFTLSNVVDGIYPLFTGNPASSFASVNVGGSPLTFDGGDSLWKGTVGGFDYAYSDALSTLTIAVPEPGTWILAGIGLTFLLHRKSRRLDP